MILADTSAWIEFLRDTGSRECIRIEALLAGGIATCDPIRMELLAGARNERHLHELRRLVARAAVIPIRPVDFEQAALLYRQCRGSGETVRSLVDCLIGALAIRVDVPVLHHDADFEVLARYAPLRIDVA